MVLFAVVAPALSACGNKKYTTTLPVPDMVVKYMLPNTGAPGVTVTVVGENFGSDKSHVKVFFDGQEATVTAVTPASISLVVPAIKKTAMVTVQMKGKTSNGTLFHYKQEEEGGTLTSSGRHWIPLRVKELNVTKVGQYIRLKDEAILMIAEGGSKASISRDEGSTWTDYPLFDAQRYNALSPIVVQMRNGTIVLGFTNGKEKANWNWNKETHDSPGAELPSYTVRSLDGGKTWQDLVLLHKEWTGMNRDIKETNEGNVVFATMKMLHNPGRHAVLTYTSKDNGVSWVASNILDMGGSGDHSGTMESTFEQLKDGRLYMLLRTNWGFFYETFSSDQGLHWSYPVATKISASSSPGVLKRLESGRLALVYNDMYQIGKTSYPLLGGDNNLSEVAASWQRRELVIRFSEDEGKTWTRPQLVARVYEPEASPIDPWDAKKWLSYPQLFEAQKGILWITTGHGGLKVKLKEADFADGDR